MVTAVNREGTRDRGRSRREQYRSMLRLAAAHSPRREALAGRGVDEVRLTLRRHDRIEWFLRLWCRDILYHAQELPNFSPKQQRRYAELRRAFRGVPRSQSSNARSQFLHLWWRLSVAASKVPLLAGSLRSLDLRRFRTFDAALAALVELDKRAAEVMDHQQDVETVISFPDGWRWVSCYYHASTVEGRLMHHCGNSATRDTYFRLLSLREPVSIAGATLWKPHLTFTCYWGMLGEMKGQGNQKPHPRYHRYIVALLRHPTINGFDETLRASPESDFELADLEPALRARVLYREQEFIYEGRENAMAVWRARHTPKPAVPAVPVAPAAPTPEARDNQVQEPVWRRLQSRLRLCRTRVGEVTGAALLRLRRAAKGLLGPTASAGRTRPTSDSKPLGPSLSHPTR